MKYLITLCLALTTGYFAIAASGINADSGVTEHITYTQGGTAVAMGKYKGPYGALLVVTNDNPASATFTASAASDTLTVTSHGYREGLIVTVSSTTTLPAGLSGATNYFVTSPTTNTFKLATSLANAQAGTAIDLTTAGTGTHTVLPTALAGASVKLQASIDGTNYADVNIKATGDATKSASISGSGNIFLQEPMSDAYYYRVYYTITSGQLTVVHKTALKP